MKKEYTPWRQFLAHVGLVTLLAGIPAFIYLLCQLDTLLSAVTK